MVKKSLKLRKEQHKKVAIIAFIRVWFYCSKKRVLNTTSIAVTNYSISYLSNF